MTRPALVVLLLCSTACTPPDVLAKVGPRRVTEGDVAYDATQRGPRPPKDAVDALIAREALAAAAVARGLDQQPAVRARIRAAEREALVQALLDVELAAVDEKAALELYRKTQEQLQVREVDVAHIFFSWGEAAPGSAQRERVMSQATAAWARLIGGDDFAVVAKELSQDQATKDHGGALGVVREGQVSSELFAAAAALKEGEVSKPVETSFGLHVLKALKGLNVVKPAFEDVKGRLLAQARRDAQASFEQRTVSTAEVKRFEERIAKLGEAKR